MKKILVNPFFDALIIVDAQPTFMPGGGLPVKKGNNIVPVIKKLMYFFSPEHTIATLDKHPFGHISLASSYVGLNPGTVLQNHHGVCLAPGARFTLEQLEDYLSKVGRQVLWPNHGIIGSCDSMLHPVLQGNKIRFVLEKGKDPACDSYSAFRDNIGRLTGLGDYLRELKIRRCFFAGLALDYCVGWSALDAADEGFEVFVVEEATRAVGTPKDGVRRIKRSFAEKRVRIVSLLDIVL